MNNRGFTLIEVLLASVLLAMVGTMTWEALSATFKTQESVYKATALQELGTAIMVRLREDLSQTMHVESRRPYTFFQGDDNHNHDAVHVTTLSHYPSTFDAQESDQAEVSYITETNPKDSTVYLLMRREIALVDGEVNDDNDGDFALLADNVLSFDVEYFDGETYRTDWDTRSPDQLNKLPQLVRVRMRLRDSRGREGTFSTLVDLPMSESLGETEIPKPPGQGGQQPPGGQQPQKRNQPPFDGRRPIGGQPR